MKRYITLKELGVNIKAAREAAGLTPEKVGGAVGVSAECIRHAEAGKVELSIMQVVRVADVCGTTVGELLDEKQKEEAK